SLAGISIGSNSNLVAGNHIENNHGNGIEVLNASANKIGATTDESRHGGSDASGNGNSDEAGNVISGNGGDGILITGVSMNTIMGGTVTGARNVIPGNQGSGISLTAGATSNQVLGNYIGTMATGGTALPNQGNGVDLAGASLNTIGGTAPGAGNLISGNN